MPQAPHKTHRAAGRARIAADEAVRVVLGRGSEVAVGVHFPHHAAQAIVDIPLGRPTLERDLVGRVAGLCRRLRLVYPALRAACSVEISGKRPCAALLLNHHRAVVDIAGGDRAAARRRDGAGSPQAVGAVGEGAETAVHSAACQPVLAVPGVHAASRK